jgi:hypothetical protein
VCGHSRQNQRTSIFPYVTTLVGVDVTEPWQGTSGGSGVLRTPKSDSGSIIDRVKHFVGTQGEKCPLTTDNWPITVKQVLTCSTTVQALYGTS